MAPLAAGQIEVFFSYSHRDEELRDQLAKHLAMLKREGVIKDWYDRRVGAGKEWAGQINEGLNFADIILLLISSDFLASDYCYDVELARAMERHEAGETRVIPIILRACDWTSAPFGKLQALPKDAKPVRLWSDQDQAFVDIAIGIRSAVEELLEKNRPENPPLPPYENSFVDKLRTKLMALRQLEQEKLINESIKQEYQRRLLDKWIDKD